MCEKPSGRKFLGVPLITYNIHPEKKNNAENVKQKKNRENEYRRGLMEE